MARARLEQLQAALAKVQQQQQSAERRARAEGQQVAELEAKQQEYARSLDKCARKLAANGATPEVRRNASVAPLVLMSPQLCRCCRRCTEAKKAWLAALCMALRRVVIVNVCAQACNSPL